MSGLRTGPDEEPAGTTPRIVQTDDTLSGRPRIEGRRIGVYMLYHQYDGGARSVTDLADTYDLSEAEVHAALAYAANNPEQMAAITERKERARRESESRVTPETGE
jgi:uncharacterized protein (DUF433 family)